MFCGVGKTHVFLYSIIKDAHETVILVMPTLTIVRQIILDYLANEN